MKPGPTFAIALLGSFVVMTAVATAMADGADAPAANESRKATYALTVERERVSLQAREASLAAIITELGRRLGVPTEIAIDESRVVTIELSGVPVEEALRRLQSAAGLGYLLVWDKAAGDTRIASIRVLARGEPDRAVAVEREAETAVEARRDAANLPRAPDEPFGFELDPRKYLKK